MQIIDLSHTLEVGMPVYPGSEPPDLVKVADIETAGYNEMRLELSTHTGTHIDCGKHFLKEGFDTGSSTPERFIGRGLVINFREQTAPHIILKSHLIPYENRLRHADFLIFHTGWSKLWGTAAYFKDYPVLDQEAARYLTGFRLKGLGTDAISFDTADVHDYPVHKILLSKEILLIENLTGLENLPEEDFIFCCFPLKIKNGDGSPVRAVGIVTSDEGQANLKP